MDGFSLAGPESPRIPSTHCLGDCHVAGYFAWDVLTASYVLWPEIFETEMERIGVCVEGKGQGAIHRKEDGGSAVRVLTRVDAAEWENRLVRALCSDADDVGST
jgi:inosine-uridine nucleoside N-ribohydrolase